MLAFATSPAVDAVMLEARAADFSKRSLKREAKQAAIDLAIRCIDLTTLEGKDSPGKVRSMCAKAVSPGFGAPSVAAVCVYPNMVAVAKAAVAGTGVKVASVATAFPSGLSSLEVKLRDTEAALAAGADEIDMVINRGALLAGDEQLVFDEIAAVKRLCGDVHVKAILEAGELGSYDAIRRASDLCLEAGADTIKTSTGKIGISATLPISLAMCQSIHAFYHRTGDSPRLQSRRRHPHVEGRALVSRPDRRSTGRRLARSRSLPPRSVVAARRSALAARKRTHRPLPVTRHHSERLGGRHDQERTGHSSRS